jgi:poly-gamma-glutamate capsule biosynthesis protein CapA/YwtB (metallophosphatase superfamily)
VSARLALTGDSLITRAWPSVSDSAVHRMLHSADVAFTNVETLFHRFERPPMAVSGGLYVQADPATAGVLSELNIRLASVANNHACDYGVETLLSSIEVLTEVGVRCSGAGKSLNSSRAPAVIEVGGMHIALISMASTFPEHARAANGEGEIRPRGGVNPLRFTTLLKVTGVDFARLEHIFDGIATAGQSSPSTLLLPAIAIVSADKHGLLTLPHPGDLSELTKLVEQTAESYDATVVSIHSHETSPAGGPAVFLRIASRRFIDAGASAIACHGSHVCRGVEVYNGAPIFYGLGNFFFEIEYLTRQPPDAYSHVGLASSALISEYFARRAELGAPDFFVDESYWTSILAILNLTSGRVTDVEFYPLDLGLDDSDGNRGRPELASPELASLVLEQMRVSSRPFGTNVTGETAGQIQLD